LWLVVVVRRLCLDHHRERYGRSRGDQDDDVGVRRAQRARLVDLVADQAAELLAASPDRAPDLVLARKERTAALSASLERLEPEDRLLLRLRFGEDLSAREIGTLLHFPTVFHVYRRLDRVLKELRASLLKLGVREPEP
jgi:RNA polymerase sigma factor (sigma-70 family)